MPKIQLASQRLQRAQQGGLSPQLLSSRSAGQIQAAQIGTPRVAAGAGQIQYSPFPVPDIQKNTLTTMLESGAGLADTLINSAFKYQQRQDQAVADYQVLEADKELRTMLYGELTEDGTLKGGYLNTTKLAASQGYGGFQGGVREHLQKRIENLTPQQRQFAMSRLHQLENSYLTKGATHASSELAAAEAALVDQTYTMAMESMQTNLITGQMPDLHQMAAALNKYPDADDRKKRDIHMTNVALSQALRVRGPAAALALAVELDMTAGVGDAPTIQNFVENLKANARAEKGEVRSDWHFAEAQRTAARGRAVEVANNYLVQRLSSALTQGRSGEVLGAAAGMYPDAATAQTNIEPQLRDAVKQGWENAKGVLGGTDAYAETVRGQLDTINPLFRDDVARQLVELERAEDEQVIKDAERQIKVEDLVRDQEFRAARAQVDDVVKRHSQGGLDLGSVDVREEIDLLYKGPLADADRTRLERVTGNSTNPFAAEVLRNVDKDWQTYVDNPADIEALDIPHEDQQQLLKRANTDRAAGAAPHRTAAIKQLQTLYKLEDKGGFLMFGGEETADGLNQDQVLVQYNSTLSKLHSLIDEELRPDRNRTPAGAVHSAMAKLYSDPVVYSQMVGLPPTKLAEGKVDDTSKPIPRTYIDNHEAPLAMYRIPQGFIPGLEGDVNVLRWVSTIGEKEQRAGEEVPDPELMLLNRVNVIFARLKEMNANAQTSAEADEISRMITHHTAQANIAYALKPATVGATTSAEKVKKVTDGDTIETKDKGRVRNTNLAASESDTPEGVLQQDKVERAMMSLSPEGQFEFKYIPGTGAFNRRLGDATIGDADMDVIAREELGIPPYKGNK